MTLDGKLIDYPTKRASLDFNVKVYSGTWTHVPDQQIPRVALPANIQLKFNQYPDEELAVQYEALLSDDSRLPSWLSFDQDHQAFKIASESPDYLGEYELKVVARFHLFPNNDIAYKFKLKITDEEE